MTFNKYCSTCLMTQSFTQKDGTLECPVCKCRLHGYTRPAPSSDLLNARFRKPTVQRKRRMTIEARRLTLANDDVGRVAQTTKND